MGSLVPDKCTVNPYTHGDEKVAEFCGYDEFRLTVRCIADDRCAGFSSPFQFHPDCKRCQKLMSNPNRICNCVTTGVVCKRARHLIRFLHHVRYARKCPSVRMNTIDGFLKELAFYNAREPSEYQRPWIVTNLNFEVSLLESSFQKLDDRFGSDLERLASAESTHEQLGLCEDEMRPKKICSSLQLQNMIMTGIHHLEYQCEEVFTSQGVIRCNHIRSEIVQFVRVYYFLTEYMKDDPTILLEAVKILFEWESKILQHYGVKPQLPKSLELESVQNQIADMVTNLNFEHMSICNQDEAAKILARLLGSIS